jgi:hypothetical protein
VLEPIDRLVERICALQSPGGTYTSHVRFPFGDVEDINCFVTALVLRETADLPGYTRLDDSRRRAQGFLLRSQNPVYRYAYAFYPHSQHPFWMAQALYPDADDTAVALLTLVREEKQPFDSLAYVAENYLLKYRAAGALARHIRHPWQHGGAFLTWFSTTAIENPIDCCVNTNVLALLAFAGLTSLDGYAAACEMVTGAARQVADGRLALSSATPFYPHLGEWYCALAYAVSMGATELVPARDALAEMPAVRASLNAPSGVPTCSSIDGRLVWRADVLWHARCLRRRVLGER